MAERTKTVIDYEFYYPDPRQYGTGFIANAFTYDAEAGDELLHKDDGGRELRYPDGRVIVVQPFWLWLEKRLRKVVVQEP